MNGAESAEITPDEWDIWREDHLTIRCLGYIRRLVEEEIGRVAREEAEENYSDLFADPARQARYAALRGRIEGVNDILRLIQIDLDNLTEENATQKDRP